MFLSYILRTFTSATTLQVAHPDPPAFALEELACVGTEGRLRITWIPERKGFGGSDFFVKYRIKDEKEWIKTEHIVFEDFVIINNLTLYQTYEIIVASVDGDHVAESQATEIFIGRRDSSVSGGKIYFERIDIFSSFNNTIDSFM